MVLASRSAAIALAQLLLSSAAMAQVPAPPYPSRSVRVIVPYPPGGGNDIIGRAVGEELTARLGQSFFVDNRPGGSTIIGAEAAARAPNDGHTLFVASQTTFAIVPHLKAKVPYDPVRDFEPISTLATQPFLLAVHRSLPARSLRDIISMAKAKPGSILFAAPPTGSGAHLAMELFKLQTGIELRYIPYKGSAPALVDMLGGQIPMIFTTTSSLHPHVTAGRLNAVAISAMRRHPTLPGVPTFAESLPGFEASQWIALSAPRATSKPIVDRLNAALVAISGAEPFRSRMAAQGYDAESSSPQQLAQRIRTELDRYGALIRKLGMKDEE